MQILAGIFSLLVGIAGWFYLFYSRAVQNLAPLEDARLNRLRARLRRAGGLLMLLLAGCFFAMFRPNLEGRTVAMLMLGVLCLLAAIILLALIDMRLTWRLRQRARKRDL
ncbi:MAG TPA: hypothetical protein VIL86_20545 [Tepidisphaeraceae bacterium]